MANLLKNLKLQELSLVDAGANQHSSVTIFKRANDPLAEKIIKFYGDEKKIEAKEFKELLEANESRSKLWEIREELYPLFNALTDSINTIISDEKISMAEKMPRIERNVNDFLVAVRDKIPDVEEDLLKFLDDLNLAKQEEKSEMAENKTIEELTKSLETANAKLAKAEALAKMSDDEKAYMAKMSDDEKAAFMALSAADRAKKMEGVKKNDETVTVEGVVISKSAVGNEQFAIFKAQAERIAKAEELIAKAEEKAAFAVFEKRAASEMANLPGTDTEHAHVLKAVDAIQDEVAKTQLEAIIKSANEANGKMFETVGKKSGEVEKSLEGKIEKLADEIAKRDSISKAEAIAKAWAENPDLYNEYEGRE